MSAFEKWLIEQGFPTDPVDHAMHAAFNAGMTRAAEICEGEIFADIEAYDDACKDCKHAILKARDGV